MSSHGADDLELTEFTSYEEHIGCPAARELTCRSPDVSVSFEIRHDGAIDAEDAARRRDQSVARETYGSDQGGHRPVGLSVLVKRMALPHLGQRKARSWDVGLAG
jgi:hypothetical protein